MYNVKTKTIYSGNPASFTVQSGESIGSVKAAIEPVQNYNGYDRPWAAGAGDNKAYWPTLTNSSSGDVDYTILDDGNTLHVEGTASANSTPWATSQSNNYANMPLGPYPAGTYTIIANGLVCQNTNNRIAFTARYADSSSVSGGSGRISGTASTIPNGTGKAVTFTATDEFKIGFYMFISSGTSVNCDVKIQLEEGSSLSQWSPYANVCPITGWTGANITRTGINFAKNVRKGTTVAGGTTKTFTFSDDGSFTVTSSGGTSTTTQAMGLAFTTNYTSSQSAALYALPDLFVLKAGETYTVRDCVISVFTGGVETRSEYGDYLYLSSHRNTVVTPSSDMHVKQIRVFYRPATQYDGQFVYEPMVFEGTTAEYEPFGEVYSVDWTSAAGTVYAGSYEAASGKLKARPQYSAYNGETLVGPWLSSMDVYEEGATPTTGAQVVDLGGTETEYALTPQTVSVLVGQNYVWSDLGSTVYVSVLSDSVAFHTLAIADSPQTRCRIYFIGDSVDCTDDDDVQSNGTLLVGAVGDTDSNGRIGQDGITFTEYYNPELNIEIGRAVSSQIEMTLLNTDGALNNFGFGRCKVYLDVYDSVNSSWISCPMGVFRIELPTRRKTQLIKATGFDQMQDLDEICDSWWSGLDWDNGLTLLQIVQSMATKVGVSVSANTASAIVNSSVTYVAAAPFNSIEMTYRELLGAIAEATCTVARFDRDGALDLKWFGAAQIGGNTVQIDTDTMGNQCLGIDLAEYQVAAIDKLKVSAAEDDTGVTVGSGTNQYAILGNLFLSGTVSTTTARATPIYNRLNGLGAYKPIQSKLIWDWSIEAGDIIQIVRDSTTYTVPIFQQTMKWRGGYVVSEVVNSGDSVHPVPAYSERNTYRMQSEFGAKRATATLSSAGWYRVLAFDSDRATDSNDALGVFGTIIDVFIARRYANGVNEVHKVTLLLRYNGVHFVNEVSSSGILAVSKIRWNYETNNTAKGYLDIYYDFNLANIVTVWCNVYPSYPSGQNWFSACGLSSVAASPSGETVMEEYTFTANGTDNFKTISVSKTTTSGYFQITDASVTEDSRIIASPKYFSTMTAVPWFITTQAQAGSCNIYVRDASGNIPTDGTRIDVDILIDNR